MSKPPSRIDADIVCLQEVAPASSFEEDFTFTEDLGYDGKDMF
jgi:endonuclease/exonuclease/phosphatase family metal-dependent hydrolase